MDFKDYLNKPKSKIKSTESLENKVSKLSSIEEGEDMTQEQFQMLINEIKFLRQDINKMNEGVVRVNNQPTPNVHDNNTMLMQQQNISQPANVVKDTRGFSHASGKADIMAQAGNILG